QKRKKWLTTGCKSRPRCAWQRCRKIVTAAIVTCVSASVSTTYPHHGSGIKPWESSESTSKLIACGSLHQGTQQGKKARILTLLCVRKCRPGRELAVTSVRESRRRRALRFAPGSLAQQTHLALRIGYANAMGAEGVPDAAIERRAQVAVTLLRITNPDP